MPTEQESTKSPQPIEPASHALPSSLLPKDADVELAKKIALVSSIRRRERLQSYNDNIGFFTRRLIGVSSLMLGCSEYFDPSLLPIVIEKPLWAISVGVALLTGTDTLSALERLVKALEVVKKNDV